MPRPAARQPVVHLALLLAATLAFALLPAAATAAQPGPSADRPGEEVDTDRIGGRDRFETAANVAAATFDRAEVVHLATGQDFPDALTGTYAAGLADGPLLLTARDVLPGRTRAELERLAPRLVVLIGGTAAIGADVEAELVAAGYDTLRLGGADRFATAAAVALAQEGEPGGVARQRTAVLASGEGFADALAIGPVAAALGLPLLLTPAARPAAVVDRALEELAIERLLVVGGSAAVGEEVAAHYLEQGYFVERLAGADRTATASAIADAAIERFGFSAEHVLLTRGDDYPDALAAGVHAARLGAPLLLAMDPATLGTPTGEWLTAACPGVALVRTVGGAAAVGEETVEDARRLAGSCDRELWTSCTNAEAGYTIAYPQAWATNEDHIDELPPCSMFDPDPAQIRAEGMEVPADVAVFLRVDEADFDEVVGPGPFEEQLSRAEVVLGDRRAERLEVRALEGGFFPVGTLSTRWTIDLGGRVFSAVSHDVGEPAYEEKTRVLDQMVVTVRFPG